jgi:hypothetical protein
MSVQYARNASMLVVIVKGMREFVSGLLALKMKEGVLPLMTDASLSHRPDPDPMLRHRN